VRLIVGLMQNAFAFLFPRLFFIGVFLTDHSVIAHPYHGGWMVPLARFFRCAWCNVGFREQLQTKPSATPLLE